MAAVEHRGLPKGRTPEEENRPGVSPVALVRFVRQISQDDLARRAGVSEKTIGRVERGELPRMRTAVAIAEALGAPLEQLFPTTSEATAPNGGSAKTARQRRHDER